MTHLAQSPIRPSAYVELAQGRIPDVVLSAGLFKPNAGGRHELSPTGFARRQLLKGASCYHGERVVVAVTALHVWALELTLVSAVRTEIRWGRSAVVVRRVATQGTHEDLEWPAFRLSAPRALAAIELVIRHRDEQAADVMRALGLRPRN
jgi:hypothetical protein